MGKSVGGFLVLVFLLNVGNMVVPALACSYCTPTPSPPPPPSSTPCPPPPSPPPPRHSPPPPSPPPPSPPPPVYYSPPPPSPPPPKPTPTPCPPPPPVYYSPPPPSPPPPKPTPTPCPPPPPVSYGTPTPTVPTPTVPIPAPPSQSCPINVLKLSACVDVLGGLLHLGLGQKATSVCCPVVSGLVGLDAALCLCTTIHAKLLNIDIVLPIALQVLADCGKYVPSDYKCPAY